jgi:hypothetical protein
LDGTTFSFYTPIETVVQNESGSFTTTNLEIREGKRLTYSWVVDQESQQRFIIPNQGVDHDSIEVTIRESSGSSLVERWSVHGDINEIDGTSLVYFIQEVPDQLTEIYFGDGTVGKSLENGNVVEIEYTVTSGSSANGCKTFSLSGSFISGTVSISTTQSAENGTDAESIESIRFRAPRSYEAQNRAVTITDYETLIKKDYPFIDSLRVWGGEDNDPPKYGVVFVSIKPQDSLYLSSQEKNKLINDIIKKRNIISTEVQIIDPDFTYLVPQISVRYDSSLTNLTTGEIKNAVIAASNTYVSTYLNEFKKDFRESRYHASLMASNSSVQSVRILLQLKGKLTPTLNVPTEYTIQFNNTLDQRNPSISKYCVSSSEFTYNGNSSYIEDDGEGNLSIYRNVDGKKEVLNSNAGTVDYTNGKVVLKNFSPSAFSGDTLDIIVWPEVEDITTLRNQILLIEESDLTITLTDEKEQ